MKGWVDRLTDVATIVAGGCALVVTGIVISREMVPAAVVGGPVLEVFEDWEHFAEGGHRLGPTDASITIVEFGDYECPYCRAAAPHLASILRNYADVAFVYRHLPLRGHAAAYPAAKAAECAATQGAFWALHDLLYASSAWQYGNTLEVLTEMSAEAGVANEGEFRACLEGESPVSAIAADQTTASNAGITGTPTFLVNGRKYMGVLDSLEFADLYRDLRR